MLTMMIKLSKQYLTNEDLAQCVVKVVQHKDAEDIAGLIINEVYKTDKSKIL